MSEDYANTNLESMVPAVSSEDDVVKIIADTVKKLKSNDYTVNDAQSHLMQTFTPDRSAGYSITTSAWDLAASVTSYISRNIHSGYIWITNLRNQIKYRQKLIQRAADSRSGKAVDYRSIANQSRKLAKIASICAQNPEARPYFITSSQNPDDAVQLTRTSFAKFLMRIHDVLVHNIRISKQIHKLSKSIKSFD